MPNAIQLKRRISSTGVSGVTLQTAELLWQEYDNQLLIKKSTGDIVPIGGEGNASSEGMVTKANRDQTIAGTKTFSGTVNQGPSPASTSSTSSATSASTPCR